MIKSFAKQAWSEYTYRPVLVLMAALLLYAFNFGPVSFVLAKPSDVVSPAQHAAKLCHQTYGGRYQAYRSAVIRDEEPTNAHTWGYLAIAVRPTLHGFYACAVNLPNARSAGKRHFRTLYLYRGRLQYAKQAVASRQGIRRYRLGPIRHWFARGSCFSAMAGIEHAFPPLGHEVAVAKHNFC